MPIISVQEWITILGRLYDQFGYLIVIIGTLCENTALLGLLLPGNTLVLLGAFYARQGSLNLGLVILFASLGTVLGYHIDYLLGRFFLLRLVNRWSTSRSGRRLRLAGRLRLSRMMLTRHGGKAILISHAIGHLRSFVALSAGMTHMRYSRFLAFELVAAVLWNGLFSLLGYFIAMQVDQLHLLLERSGGVILIIFVLLFIAWRLLRRTARQRIRRSRRAAHAASQ